MKITVNQLRKIIKEEVNNELFLTESKESALEVLSNALRDFADTYLASGLTVKDVCELIMNEAQGTCDEINKDNKEMLDDYEECGECGFDHAYEQDEAHAEHKKLKLPWIAEPEVHKRTPYQHYLAAGLDSVYAGEEGGLRKIDAMVYSIYEDWKAAFTKSDPSMGPAGNEAWIDQCDLALNSMDEKINTAISDSDTLLIDEMKDKIESIINNVEKKLFNGEFAKKSAY